MLDQINIHKNIAPPDLNTTVFQARIEPTYASRKGANDNEFQSPGRKGR